MVLATVAMEADMDMADMADTEADMEAASVDLLVVDSTASSSPASSCS